MTTYGKILSLNDYEEMNKVWIAEAGDQTLFLLRVPNDWDEMNYSQYLELMKIRFEWMMTRWVEESPNPEESKNELEEMLIMTLKQLNPSQEAPSRKDWEGEDKQLWAWAMSWAESLLEFDSTWMEWFEITNPEIEFPIDLKRCQTPTAAAEQHNEISIDQFLTELRTPIL